MVTLWQIHILCRGPLAEGIIMVYCETGPLSVGGLGRGGCACIVKLDPQQGYYIDILLKWIPGRQGAGVGGGHYCGIL